MGDVLETVIVVTVIIAIIVGVFLCGRYCVRSNPRMNDPMA